MSKFEFLETRSRTTAVSLAFMATGFFMVIIGNELSDNGVVFANVDVGSFISNAGAFIAVVALMQWLYDWFVKRKFFEEIMTSIMSTRSLFDSGIVEAFSNSTKADHTRLVIESSRLVLIFAHSKRFFDSYYDEFIARTKSGKKTVLFCNHPKSAACQYYKMSGRNETYVDSSIDELVQVVNKLNDDKNVIELNYMTVVPRYALIMFDDIAYVIMATSSEGQATVPALAVRRGSPIWDFLENDLDKIRANHIYAETLSGT